MQQIGSAGLLTTRVGVFVTGPHLQSGVVQRPGAASEASTKSRHGISGVGCPGARREQRLAERFLENEALRGDLDDADLAAVQDWLLAASSGWRSRPAALTMPPPSRCSTRGRLGCGRWW